jgi:hypothetical protein
MRKARYRRFTPQTATLTWVTTSWRKTSMYDPNTGTYTYDYNAYGELTANGPQRAAQTTLGYNDIGQPTIVTSKRIIPHIQIKNQWLPNG